MKKITTAFLILFIGLSLASQAQAPGWAWAKNGGGAGDEAGKSVANDLNGNVFITGFFRSKTIQFGTITLANTDTTGNTDDIFLVKYDSAGTLLWAKSFGGRGDDEGSSLSTDYMGNVYLTANFTSLTLKVGFITLTNANTDSLSLNYDGFTAQFSSLGNVIWAKRFGNIGDDNINGISTDLVGNTYITGSFNSDTVYFDTLKVVSDGSVNLFIAKLNLFGDVVWAKSAGGNMEDKSLAIATDSIGNIAITGYFFSNSIAFDNFVLHKKDTSGSVSGGYTNDIFTTKYNPLGNVMWAKSAGGSNLYVDDISSNSVAMSSKGEVCITGYFRYDSLYFDSLKLYSSFESRDVFVAKYNSGGRIMWAKRAGDNLDDEGRGIAVDKLGNIYVAGYFSNDTIAFDSVSLTGHSLDAEIYVVKISPAGTVIWAKSAGGVNGDFCNAVSAFDINKVYITGQYYSSSIAFDGSVVTNQAIGDVFVARLYPITVGLPAYTDLSAELIIYPNPAAQYSTIKYSLKYPASVSIEIYNELGEKVSTIISRELQSEGEYNYIFSAAHSGIYFVKLQTSEGVLVKRIMFSK